MLRKSRINPKLSASTHIFGQYVFNRAPMAPPGTRMKAHETLNRRSTWAPHGLDGWYLGPALEHYRCYTVYITKTRGNRIMETVEFFPIKFTLPFPAPQDLAAQAATDLTDALLHPQADGLFCQVGDAQTQKLTFPPTKRRTTMHLRGCVPMSHLRGCQTQQHSICLLVTANHQT
jgi:hypothetical protein